MRISDWSSDVCSSDLLSDLADAWATYGADRDLLAIAQATAANARESVRLTQARLDGGIAPRTDLRQAEQILATAEDAIAAQTSALAQDANLIRLLIGGDVDLALLPASLARSEEHTSDLQSLMRLSYAAF